MTSKSDPAFEKYARDVDEQHERRVARLLLPDGWLALVAKAFLHDGENAVGSAPDSVVTFPADAPATIGVATRRGREVRFVPDASVEVTVDGERVPSDGVVMRSDAQGRAATFAVGRFTFQLMERGEALAIRVRDPDSEQRRAFAGIDRFPVDPRWNVEARFVAEPEHPVDFDFEGDSITHAFVSPGRVEFDVGGVTHRLIVVYEDDTHRRLFVLFGDATNGKETYGIGRFFYAPLAENGRVMLDFNTAMLPACAFTHWATCPLPPGENRLPLRVEAGEKNLR